MNNMKKLFVVALCALIVSVPKSVGVSAANVSSFEMIHCQYKDIAELMRTDVIEYKYREYNGRLQYRRWNVTQNCWVDPYWIYAGTSIYGALDTKNQEVQIVVEQYFEKMKDNTGSLEEETIMEELEETQKVQTALEQYFEIFLGTMLQDSDKDYSRDDFASINGYIIAKELVGNRYTYNTLLGGIHTVDVWEVTIDDLTTKENHLEAMAYVKYKFSYGNNEESDVGCLYRIILEKSGDEYEVTDLDNTDVETRMAKETLKRNEAEGTSDPYSIIDSYFEKMKDNADSLVN